MSERDQAQQSVLLTIALAVAVNIFTSLLSGGIALFFLLLAAVVSALLLKPWSFTAGGFASGTRSMAWRTTVQFTSVMVLIGAGIGAVCILPIFPAQALRLGFVESLAEAFPRDWIVTSGVNGYELLAAGLLALAALATLIRGRHFITALQFILASAAGCVAVFATARSTIDFNDAWLTYIGIVLGAVAATAVGLAIPSFWRVLRHLFGPTPDPELEHDDQPASASGESDSSTEEPRPRRALPEVRD